jgi:hypothetical protein
MFKSSAYIVTCQRIARQRLEKHLAIHACNNRTNVYSSLLANSSPMDWRDSYHLTCFLFGLRYVTLELCFLCVVRAERIWDNTGLGIDFIRIPKFQGKNSVARRRIRRLSVWRYMCYSYSNLESVKLIVVTTSGRVQEGSAVESTRTRMERVRSELWRLGTD